MPKIKWSSFPDVGSITTGDKTVGLRSGTNVQLDANAFSSINIDNIQIDGNAITSTNTNGNIQLNANGTGQVEIDDPGLETGGILVDGATFNTAFRVNDIGGIAPAQMILHKHSTTLEPILLSARSNSNTSAHATVTNGMPVMTIYGTGWLNSYYGTMASITFSADSSGTLADGSSPGRLQFNVTPNGALLPVEAMRINNNGIVTLANALPVGSGGSGRTTATAYGVICGGTTSTATHQSVASVGTTGQVLTSNGAGALPSFQGGLITSVVQRVFTSSGTYTPTSGMKYCVVYCIGAGGAGGGSSGVTPVNVNSAGAGGGSGAMAISTITAATIGVSQTVTIGTGGVGVAGANGGNGGSSSLGSLVVAAGGSGGAVGSIFNNVVAQGGNGGATYTGDYGTIGQIGGPSIIVSTGQGTTGGGGNTIFGSGGSYIQIVGAGIAGTNGAGGSGAQSYNGSAANAGGNGGNGIIVIYEYISN